MVKKNINSCLASHENSYLFNLNAFCVYVKYREGGVIKIKSYCSQRFWPYQAFFYIGFKNIGHFYQTYLVCTI